MNDVTKWLLSKGIGQYEYPYPEGPLIEQIGKNQVYIVESRDLVGTFSLQVLGVEIIEGWRLPIRVGRGRRR